MLYFAGVYLKIRHTPSKMHPDFLKYHAQRHCMGSPLMSPNNGVSDFHLATNRCKGRNQALHKGEALTSGDKERAEKRFGIARYIE